MELSERINEKLKTVGGMYPDQHDRLSKCVSVVLERGAEPLHRGMEKQLDQLAAMSSPEKARKTIDKIEHTVFQSKVASPFLGARESKKALRLWILVGAGVLFCLLFLVAYGRDLMTFFGP